MSYYITAISNGGGAPESAYRKLQEAGACPEAPHAGELGQLCYTFCDYQKLADTSVTHML